MKQIKHYIPLSKTEIAGLWDKALIILDANALLDLYRYTDKTREECLDVFRRVREQLWIPHQVAIEFYKNRPEVILSQLASVERVRKMIEALKDKCRQELDKLFTFRSHPVLDRASIEKRILATMDAIDADLSVQLTDYPDFLADDPVLTELLDLFAGRVGLAPDEGELKRIYTLGKDRYANRVPPGYADAQGPNKKDGNNIYGDLILWCQILQKAESDKRGVIFVTNDGKEDWWWRVQGKTMGCLPQLREELFSRAGTNLILYATDRFMSYAKEHHNARVTKRSLKEVRDVSAELWSSRNFIFTDQSSIHPGQIIDPGTLDAALKSWPRRSPSLFTLDPEVAKAIQELDLNRPFSFSSARVSGVPPEYQPPSVTGDVDATKRDGGSG